MTHEIKYYTRKCKGCGKTFKRREIYPSRAKKEYCSNECHKKYIPRRIPFDSSIRKYIFSRDHDRCRYCGERAECIDHVNPVSNGGRDSKSNLVACCTACNMAVMDRIFDNFNEKKQWVLKARKITITKVKPINYDRPSWHKFVYGGSRH